MHSILKAALFFDSMLVVASPAGAQDDCDRPNGTFDQIYCQIKALTRTDADLNVAYAALLKKLPPASQERLRETQRAWVAGRDRECVEYSEHRGDAFYVGCAVDTTTDRLNFLNDRLRECNSGGCQLSRLS